MTITVKLTGAREIMAELNALRQHVTDTTNQIREEIAQMAQQIKSQFDEVIRLMDAETTALATRVEAQHARLSDAVQRLDDALKNGNPDGLTAAEAIEEVEKLRPFAARLRSLASDPSNPVPGGVTEPAPVTPSDGTSPGGSIA